MVERMQHRLRAFGRRATVLPWQPEAPVFRQHYHHHALALEPTAGGGSFATLLPSRAELFVRLDERMPTADRSPVALVLLGLLREDDGWPTPASTLGEVTALVARSLRGDDWLARSGPGEFAVVLNGTADSAENECAGLVSIAGPT